MGNVLIRPYSHSWNNGSSILDSGLQQALTAGISTIVYRDSLLQSCVIKTQVMNIATNRELQNYIAVLKF